MRNRTWNSDNIGRGGLWTCLLCSFLFLSVPLKMEGTAMTDDHTTVWPGCSDLHVLWCTLDNTVCHGGGQPLAANRLPPMVL
ncbi:hypothetical protein SLA2020_238440 [Shorea laevis]